MATCHTRWPTKAARSPTSLGAATTRPPRRGTSKNHRPPRNLCVEAPPGCRPSKRHRVLGAAAPASSPGAAAPASSPDVHHTNCDTSFRSECGVWDRALRAAARDPQDGSCRQAVAESRRSSAHSGPPPRRPLLRQHEDAPPPEMHTGRHQPASRGRGHRPNLTRATTTSQGRCPGHNERGRPARPRSDRILARRRRTRSPRTPARRGRPPPALADHRRACEQPPSKPRPEPAGPASSHPTGVAPMSHPSTARTRTPRHLWQRGCHHHNGGGW
jgi:hypothetical protein